jgi:putative hydrolase of HD superfamily
LNFRALARFIHETGQLKKNPRSGWLSINIANPESIADHAWRTSLVGFILARMEKADTERVMELCLFHDLHETRLGDLNYVSTRYIKKNSMKAVRDQLKGVFCAKEIESIMRELFACKTKEAIVAKDADLLEMIAQARDYMDAGNKYAEEWITDAKRKLKTKSARKLARELEKTSSNEFWLELN